MATMTTARTVNGVTSSRATAGWVTIVGAVTMLVGAVLNTASGPEYEGAVTGRDVAGYLTDLDAARTVAIAGFSVWMVAICILCAGGVLLAASSSDGVARRISTFAFTTGAGTAVMFFSLWMAVPLVLAPAFVAGEPVETLAQTLLAAAVNADWLITVMIVGVGAGFMAIAGRGDWAPGWLVGWGRIALAVGAASLVLVVLGMWDAAFVIVPVGLGLMLASGIAAVRGRA